MAIDPNTGLPEGVGDPFAPPRNGPAQGGAAGGGRGGFGIPKEWMRALGGGGPADPGMGGIGGGWQDPTGIAGLSGLLGMDAAASAAFNTWMNGALNKSYGDYNDRALQAYQGDQNNQTQRLGQQAQLSGMTHGQDTLKAIFGQLAPGGLSGLFGGSSSGAGQVGGGTMPMGGFQSMNSDGTPGRQSASFGQPSSGGGLGAPPAPAPSGGGTSSPGLGALVGAATGGGYGASGASPGSQPPPLPPISPQQKANSAGMNPGQQQLYQAVLAGMNGPQTSRVG